MERYSWMLSGLIFLADVKHTLKNLVPSCCKNIWPCSSFQNVQEHEESSEHQQQASQSNQKQKHRCNKENQLTFYEKLRHIVSNVEPTMDHFDLSHIMKIRDLEHKNAHLIQELNLPEPCVTPHSSLCFGSSQQSSSPSSLRSSF